MVVQKGVMQIGIITKGLGIHQMAIHTDQTAQILTAQESEAIKIRSMCRKFVKRREIETTNNLGTNIQVLKSILIVS